MTRLEQVLAIAASDARMAELDREVAAWNDALASGDAARIEAARTATLSAVHERIMTDDDYQGRTHAGRCAR